MRRRSMSMWLAVGLVWLLLPCNAMVGQRLMQAAKQTGPNAALRMQALLEDMRTEAGADEQRKIKAINDFFNLQILFRSDQENWGLVDYWSSPMELLNKGAGDCEDYAIAKYFSLIAMGVTPSKMRLVYVRAQLGASVQAHMVLAYYPAPTEEPLILDNLITDPRPSSRRTDLIPVFSFNAEGLWQGVGSSTAGDPVARLSRWREVLTKAKAEGWW